MRRIRRDHPNSNAKIGPSRRDGRAGKGHGWQREGGCLPTGARGAGTASGVATSKDCARVCATSDGTKCLAVVGGGAPGGKEGIPAAICPSQGGETVNTIPGLIDRTHL